MSLPASPSKVKFLLDENVKRRLERFLVSRGFDVIIKRGVANGKLAGISKAENRVLVTNDDDFDNPLMYPREKVFSVVLLRIPQDEPKALIDSFSRMLEEDIVFEGNLMVLTKEGSKVSPLRSVE